MALLNDISCISIDAPPRQAEKSATYVKGLNGGIIQLEAAPPVYTRQFVAFIPDANLTANYTGLATARSTGAIIDVQGKGISTKAVLLDFEFQIGQHVTLATVPGVIALISANLTYAVP